MKEKQKYNYSTASIELWFTNIRVDSVLVGVAYETNS